MKYSFLQLACLLLGSVIVSPSLADEPVKAAITYDEHVEPVLRRHCLACHNQDDPSSDLALDQYATTLEGGAGGEVVVGGDPTASRLWRLVNHEEQPAMPPGGDKLPDADLKVIREWIAGGLLQNAGSKPKKQAAMVMATDTPTVDKRPKGEPAMPSGLYREPVVVTPRAAASASVATSPWAPVVAVAGHRQVLLYKTGPLTAFDKAGKYQDRLLGVLPYADGVPQVLRFSRDGSLLLVAGGEHALRGTATLYDVESGTPLGTFADELDILLAADLSPDKSLIAVGGPKKKARVYRTSDGSLAYEVGKHTDWITAIEFSPNGEYLATADRAGGLRLWQATAGHERNELRGHKAMVTGLSWRHDSQMLASASEEGTVRLWSPEGKSLKAITAHKGGVASLAFAANNQLATAGRDKQVALWDTNGKRLATIAMTDDLPLAVALNQEATQAVVSDWTGKVQLVDVKAIDGDAIPLIVELSSNPLRLSDRVAQVLDAQIKQTEQLKASQSKLAAAEQTLSKAKTAHQQHRQQQAELQKELAAVTNLSAKLNKQLTECQALIKQLADKPASQDEAIAKQYETAIKQSDETAKDASEAFERLRALGGKLTALAKQQKGLPDVPALQATFDAAQKMVANGQVALAQETARLAYWQQEQQRFANAAEQLATQFALEQSKTEAANAQLTAVKHAKAEAQTEQDRIAAEVDQLQAKLAKLKEAKTASEQATAEQTSKVEQQQAELAEIERQRLRAEAQLKAFETAEALRKRYE